MLFGNQNLSQLETSSKHSIDEENITKLKISACGGDPRAVNNPNGGCMCPPGFYNTTSCTFDSCYADDPNSQNNGNGGCGCTQNYVNTTGFCQACRDIDPFSEYYSGSCRCITSYVMHNGACSTCQSIDVNS